MKAKRWISAGFLSVGLIGVSAAAFAVEFKPFTDVESVCQECEEPKADVISLANGDTIRGTVVAENSDFYTVVRNGEVRALPHGDVENIVWADESKPSGLSDKDQLVLDNGHILSGTIIDEKDEPAFFQLESSFSDYTYTVAKGEVEAAYKGGSEYSFSVPEED